MFEVFSIFLIPLSHLHYRWCLYEDFRLSYKSRAGFHVEDLRIHFGIGDGLNQRKSAYELG